MQLCSYAVVQLCIHKRKNAEVKEHKNKRMNTLLEEYKDTEMYAEKNKRIHKQLKKETNARTKE